MTESTHESQTETGSKTSNFINWFNPFLPGIGFKAWLLQRVSGLFLVLYLVIHFSIVGTMALDSTGALYNNLTYALNSPLIHFGEGLEIFSKMTSMGYFVDIVLIAALVYHGLNGLRVILFDLGIGIKHQKTLFWILFISGIIIWAVAMYFILIVPEIVLEGAI